ncbi:MAG: serine/threonine-protein kinase [Myxococcota bacterium]
MGREATARTLDASRSCAKRCPVCGEQYRASRRSCAHDGALLVDVPHDPLIGETLADTYRIERPLGRGGMGALYVATHLRLEREVAVKVLHEAFATHDLALARFLREAKAMARVRSPHVVQVLDALRTADGRPCLVVELVDGEDLQSRLANGRLEVDEALEYAEQLATGLRDAHEAGVVHRDLKPSNVILDRHGHARLVDFGVAHLQGDAQLTQAGTVVGTPAYMAPEQVRGASADPRVDLYGLGAVLYRALTGQAPYTGEVATAVLSEVLESPPPPPRAIAPDIPAEVESFLMRAMSRDPSTRFESAEEMARAAARLRRQREMEEPWAHASAIRAAAVSVLAALTFGLVLQGELTQREHPTWPAWVIAVAALALGIRRVQRPDPGPWAYRLLWGTLSAWATAGAISLVGLSALWPALALGLFAVAMVPRS